MIDWVDTGQEMVWEFDDCPYKMSDFQTMTIPEYNGDDYEDDWIYKKFDVVVRIACLDGTFLVVVRKKI